MDTTIEKIYKRVRQLWNDEYELNPGHRVIQSVEMTANGRVKVELLDFQFFLSVEDEHLTTALGVIPHVEAPSEETMNAIVVHVAELVKNLTGDLPVEVIPA
ncbi:hypothetical protein GCM10028803_55740 [Larkinella knui]|uniref:Uncharacterized protein n=1 Tax=Larkinella knui TaxID=2025310 RepID=A0A3P1CFU8_9BACT|nr:hypothetical protein [Larkinella knui]RRB12233.1 hypothetical protein EHT87_18680 [Larkinella knui]